MVAVSLCCSAVLGRSQSAGVEPGPVLVFAVVSEAESAVPGRML